MKLLDGTTLMHGGRPYDPVKAHEYYERTKKLKGRKTGLIDVSPGKKTVVGGKLAATVPKGSVKKKRSRSQQISDIRKKIERIQKMGKGSGDAQKRQAMEKQATAKQKKDEAAAAAREIDGMRKELSSLGADLKKKISEKAPKTEVESLKAKIEEAKGKLDEAVEKKKATKNG